MDKVKISSVTHYEKDKQGNPLISKQGKPYSRCMIKTQDNRTLSGFGSQVTQAWKPNDEVEIEITQNGQWLNFRLPPKQPTRDEFASLSFELKALTVRIETLERKVFGSVEEEIDEVFDNEEPPEAI